MKKIFFPMIIIAIVLVLGLTFIGYSLSTKNKVYYDLEDKIESSAKGYYSQYPEEFPNSKTLITSVKLIESNFLDNLTNSEENCEGYVIVTNVNNFYKYKPFIKCEHYITKKYETSKEGIFQ